MHKDITWYSELSGQILQGIGARTNAEIGAYFDDIENLENWDIGILQIGFAFDPEPLTVAGYIARGPYGHPDFYPKMLAESAERGWLVARDDGRYVLSEKGKALAEDFMSQWDGWFGALPTLEQNEIKQLADLLQRLGEAAYQAPEIEATPTLEIGINLQPGPGASQMFRVRRYLVDMMYFRDDVHLAAWRPYGVDGVTWETLTLVWRGEAADSAELAEKLSGYRHYTAEEYAGVLEDLVARGWVSKDGEQYQISETGKSLRQEAEAQTDAYFALPFKVLSDDENRKLQALLEKLAGQLPPLEDPADGAE